jgi:hypothetical protein
VTPRGVFEVLEGGEVDEKGRGSVLSLGYPNLSKLLSILSTVCIHSSWILSNLIFCGTKAGFVVVIVAWGEVEVLVVVAVKVRT